MYQLRNIQYTVQQTADAIAAALKIEVEIADLDLIRVAGTGKYRSVCNCVMNEGFVYRHVIKTGQALVIDNPGYHALCQPCIYRENCPENAEVALPIRVEGQIIGVIGLISFDRQQTERLLENQESMLKFLEKMAELIAAKIVEYQQNQQQELLNNKLLTLLNLIRDGILMVNAQKQVTNFNSLAARMLDIDSEQQVFLQQLLDDKKLWKAIERGEMFSGQVKGRKVAARLYCDAVPVKRQGIIGGVVITLKDMQSIKRLVKDTTISEIETEFSHIIGSSAKLLELKKMALQVAPSNSTILIQGESGTGKEMFARAIHQSSRRKDHSFIAINCGAIPENLLESELFGYEEGAFTGACRGGKMGKFELAHNGTIFLDEIGDMPLHLQVKLLRVLQDRRIERIGSYRSTPVDVRVIAATNRDLDKLVATGEFREDLFYRLNVIPLTIPPLRERPEDIGLLIHFFLDYYCQVTGKDIKGIDEEAAAVLTRYSWPGNVRELSNVIEYTVTMATSDCITAEMLPSRVKNEEKLYNQTVVNLKVLEREAIMKALEMAGGMGYKEEAAKLLGISRATLYRKFKEYNIAEKLSFS